MQKIAILTLYYKNYNYGGILQSFALQKVITGLGHDAKQISYILDSGYPNWNPWKRTIRKVAVSVLRYIKYGKWMRAFSHRERLLSEFADRIPHTKVVTAKTIYSLTEEYDCFVCGSDQIWNPIGWQPTFFLDFLPPSKKRVAYAPSIARDNLSDEEIHFMKRYLSDFSALSVREEESLHILKESFPEYNFQTMPDPVLLLKRSQWEEVAMPTHKTQKYIFAYFLGNDSFNRKMALEYAKEQHMKIFFVSHMSREYYQWEKQNRDVLLPPLGIKDFLEYIINADVVLTDSFHGVVFSSIFNRPFYVLPRFKENDSNSMNSRIKTILRELHIENRFCENLLGRKYAWDDESIDAINHNLERLRKKGIDYLSLSLQSTDVGLEEKYRS